MQTEVVDLVSACTTHVSLQLNQLGQKPTARRHSTVPPWRSLATGNPSLPLSPRSPTDSCDMKKVLQRASETLFHNHGLYTPFALRTIFKYFRTLTLPLSIVLPSSTDLRRAFELAQRSSYAISGPSQLRAACIDFQHSWMQIQPKTKCGSALMIPK